MNPAHDHELFINVDILVQVLQRDAEASARFCAFFPHALIF
jgi:hypothetical protein